LPSHVSVIATKSYTATDDVVRKLGVRRRLCVHWQQQSVNLLSRRH